MVCITPWHQFELNRELGPPVDFDADGRLLRPVEVVRNVALLREGVNGPSESAHMKPIAVQNRTDRNCHALDTPANKARCDLQPANRTSLGTRRHTPGSLAH